MQTRVSDYGAYGRKQHPKHRGLLHWVGFWSFKVLEVAVAALFMVALFSQYMPLNYSK